MIDDHLMTGDKAESIWAELKRIAEEKRCPDFIVVCAFLERKYALLNHRQLMSNEYYVEKCHNEIYGKIS